MVEVGVLRCPVCDRALCVREDAYEGERTLKDRATQHLRRHRLDESKRGIYRVMMTRRLQRVETDAAQSLPLEEWSTDVAVEELSP